MIDSISVRFWGVRGSIPCPGPDTLRYGGNTSCVEVRCGEHLLIFDAGSGLRALGAALDANDTEIDLFLSHGHVDHMIGLPFFSPLMEKGRRLRIWAGGLVAIGGVKNAISALMRFPLFPIGVDAAQAGVSFHDFERGEVLTPRKSLVVRTAGLDHPGGATGYRIDHAGKAICYITDNDLGSGAIDPALLSLAKGAQLVITDATYTDAELPDHAGWGHSSWQQAMRFADAAGVETLCLFHHDPDHSDAAMDEIAAEAAKARPGTLVAKEGMSLSI
ncbi:MAG: MBL fold metallo-hydrolase [Afipia sp.]|nr:MBL fold metallo-hydrolase [Afipia sp.]